MLTKDMQGCCSAPRAARLQASLRSILKAKDPIHYERLSVADTSCERQTLTAVNAQLLHVRFRSLAGSQFLHGVEPHKILDFTAAPSHLTVDHSSVHTVRPCLGQSEALSRHQDPLRP